MERKKKALQIGVWMIASDGRGLAHERDEKWFAARHSLAMFPSETA